jgi:hypothetical protein
MVTTAEFARMINKATFIAYPITSMISEKQAQKIIKLCILCFPDTLHTGIMATLFRGQQLSLKR